MKSFLLLFAIFAVFIGMLFIVSADNLKSDYIGELPVIEVTE